MALSDITFIKGHGGLNSELPGEDHISGLLFYGAKPAGFGAENEVQVFSVDEAADFGITSALSPVLAYHVSEYFRINPQGNLWVGIYAEPVGANTFAELETLQKAASGKLRQVGVYTQGVFAVAMVSALQLVINSLESQHMPLSVVLAADFTGTTLTALPDLKGSNCPGVSVCIGQSGQGVGATLFLSQGKSITCLGATLGAISRANVQDNIGNPENFDVSGTELDVVAFANGTLVKTVAKAQLDEIDGKQYVFLIKHIGLNGSFFNFDYTASTGDYDRIANNRAINKAIRLIRAALLPSLNGNVYVDPSSGELSRDTVDLLENRGRKPVAQMVRNGELSGGTLTINPAQSILSNKRLDVAADLVPVATNKAIRVSIGFKSSLA